MSYARAIVATVALVTVDSSPASALAVCRACGWRGSPRRYRADAWTEANAHVRACHRDDSAALTAAARRQARA